VGAFDAHSIADIIVSRCSYSRTALLFVKESREIAMVHTLVPSDRVETASIYSRDGKKSGKIKRLMLDKVTGTVAYAVVKCSAFPGAGHQHYPVPWSTLRYSLARKGYETSLTLDEICCGPSELDGEAFDWGDRSPLYVIRSIGRCRATNSLRLHPPSRTARDQPQLSDQRRNRVVAGASESPAGDRLIARRRQN
jgi:PRC-barrel domain